MRDALISALTYPRSVVRESVLPEDCPHNRSFDCEDHRCLTCEFEVECLWLCRNDEFAALQLRPLTDLVDALEFSLGYVQRRIDEPRHNIAKCGCATCAWSRQAEVLIEAFRNA
ncbi:MAG: hypothetical protein HY942_06710 [Gammaproteobacteria bacterium]|nr:hypothetical protein [Gammaproteobacteria bacterium]